MRTEAIIIAVIGAVHGALEIVTFDAQPETVVSENTAAVTTKLSYSLTINCDVGDSAAFCVVPGQQATTIPNTSITCADQGYQLEISCDALTYSYDVPIRTHTFRHSRVARAVATHGLSLPYHETNDVIVPQEEVYGRRKRSHAYNKDNIKCPTISASLFTSYEGCMKTDTARIKRAQRNKGPWVFWAVETQTLFCHRACPTKEWSNNNRHKVKKCPGIGVNGNTWISNGGFTSYTECTASVYIANLDHDRGAWQHPTETTVAYCHRVCTTGPAKKPSGGSSGGVAPILQLLLDADILGQQIDNKINDKINVVQGLIENNTNAIQSVIRDVHELGDQLIQLQDTVSGVIDALEAQGFQTDYGFYLIQTQTNINNIYVDDMITSLSLDLRNLAQDINTNTNLLEKRIYVRLHEAMTRVQNDIFLLDLRNAAQLRFVTSQLTTSLQLVADTLSDALGIIEADVTGLYEGLGQLKYASLGNSELAYSYWDAVNEVDGYGMKPFMTYKGTRPLDPSNGNIIGSRVFTYSQLAPITDGPGIAARITAMNLVYGQQVLPSLQVRVVDDKSTVLITDHVRLRTTNTSYLAESFGDFETSNYQEILFEIECHANSTHINRPLTDRSLTRFTWLTKGSLQAEPDINSPLTPPLNAMSYPGDYFRVELVNPSTNYKAVIRSDTPVWIVHVDSGRYLNLVGGVPANLTLTVDIPDYPFLIEVDQFVSRRRGELGTHLSKRSHPTYGSCYADGQLVNIPPMPDGPHSIYQCHRTEGCINVINSTMPDCGSYLDDNGHFCRDDPCASSLTASVCIADPQCIWMDTPNHAFGGGIGNSILCISKDAVYLSGYNSASFPYGNGSSTIPTWANTMYACTDGSYNKMATVAKCIFPESLCFQDTGITETTFFEELYTLPFMAYIDFDIIAANCDDWNDDIVGCGPKTNGTCEYRGGRCSAVCSTYTDGYSCIYGDFTGKCAWQADTCIDNSLACSGTGCVSIRNRCDLYRTNQTNCVSDPTNQCVWMNFPDNSTESYCEIANLRALYRTEDDGCCYNTSCAICDAEPLTIDYANGELAKECLLSTTLRNQGGNAFELACVTQTETTNLDGYPCVYVRIVESGQEHCFLPGSSILSSLLSEFDPTGIIVKDRGQSYPEYHTYYNISIETAHGYLRNPLPNFNNFMAEFMIDPEDPGSIRLQEGDPFFDCPTLLANGTVVYDLCCAAPVPLMQFLDEFTFRSCEDIASVPNPLHPVNLLQSISMSVNTTKEFRIYYVCTQGSSLSEAMHANATERILPMGRSPCMPPPTCPDNEEICCLPYMQVATYEALGVGDRVATASGGRDACYTTFSREPKEEERDSSSNDTKLTFTMVQLQEDDFEYLSSSFNYWFLGKEMKLWTMQNIASRLDTSSIPGSVQVIIDSVAAAGKTSVSKFDARGRGGEIFLPLYEYDIRAIVKGMIEFYGPLFSLWGISMGDAIVTKEDKFRTDTDGDRLLFYREVQFAYHTDDLVPIQQFIGGNANCEASITITTNVNSSVVFSKTILPTVCQGIDPNNIQLPNEGAFFVHYTDPFLRELISVPFDEIKIDAPYTASEDYIGCYHTGSSDPNVTLSAGEFIKRNPLFNPRCLAVSPSTYSSPMNDPENPIDWCGVNLGVAFEDEGALNGLLNLNALAISGFQTDDYKPLDQWWKDLAATSSQETVFRDAIVPIHEKVSFQWTQVKNCANTFVNFPWDFHANSTTQAFESFVIGGMFSRDLMRIVWEEFYENTGDIDTAITIALATVPQNHPQCGICPTDNPCLPGDLYIPPKETFSARNGLCKLTRWYDLENVVASPASNDVPRLNFKARSISGTGMVATFRIRPDEAIKLDEGVLLDLQRIIVRDLCPQTPSGTAFLCSGTGGFCQIQVKNPFVHTLDFRVVVSGSGEGGCDADETRTIAPLVTLNLAVLTCSGNITVSIYRASSNTLCVGTTVVSGPILSNPGFYDNTTMVNIVGQTSFSFLATNYGPRTDVSTILNRLELDDLRFLDVSTNFSDFAAIYNDYITGVDANFDLISASILEISNIIANLTGGGTVITVPPVAVNNGTLIALRGEIDVQRVAVEQIQESLTNTSVALNVSLIEGLAKLAVLEEEYQALQAELTLILNEIQRLIDNLGEDETAIKAAASKDALIVASVGLGLAVAALIWTSVLTAQLVKLKNTIGTESFNKGKTISDIDPEERELEDIVSASKKLRLPKVNPITKYTAMDVLKQS